MAAGDSDARKRADARDATERERIEQALHASEERFRRYFELGLIGMAITSPDKGVIEVNDETCRILGYERSELLQKTWAEMTHPDDLAADVAQFDRVMAGEFDGYSMDKRWIRKDGRVIDTTISVKCLRRADGSVDYFVALLQDITARKRAEETLARANEELERRVAERTRDLTQAIQELRKEIAERQCAEAESWKLRDTLAAEVAAMTRLHEFSTQLLTSTELQSLLEEILDTTIALQNADLGNIQLYNPEVRGLEIVAQRGFQKEFLDYFRVVRDDASACGRAMHGPGRIIIEDVHTDRDFEPHRHIADAAGFRAVQSTPLFSRDGKVLGMLSTHFRRPHRPSDYELRLTDLYAVHAAEMIERKQAEATILNYQRELQTLTAKLIETQETENQYLARELHDVFSQKLAVLGMEMTALAQPPPAPSEAVCRRLLEFTQQLGDLAKDIRRISRRLHPAILDELGLMEALQNECLAFSDLYGIPADFIPDEIPEVLPKDVSLCLYRVAQESLRNVGKHAHATAVRVALTYCPDDISLTIQDRGEGFDRERIRDKQGLGLVSMEERVRLVKGKLSIQSRPKEGTCVEVRISLSGANNEALGRAAGG